MWAAYGLVGVVSIVISNAQAWASGQLAVGELAPDLSYWGVFLVALLWTVAHLNRVAGSAFDAFRPALDLSDDELGALRYRLVVLPALPAWIVTVAALVITPAYYVLDPVGSDIGGLSTSGIVLRAASEAFSSAVLLLILFQLLRQMRTVDKIVATAPRVDLFQPGPLYAFSKLTSRTAIALVLLIGTSTLVVSPATLSGATFVLWAPWLLGIPAFAASAFVLPLLGMHARLVAEKERLQADGEARLRSLMQTVNRDVDAGDLGRADALNKTLSTLLQERDVIARLPTWPWSTGTLRAIITAVALPLLLFLAQRALTQLI